jgi:hypothetical protein
MRKQNSDEQHAGYMWPAEFMCAAFVDFRKNVCSSIRTKDNLLVTW